LVCTLKGENTDGLAPWRQSKKPFASRGAARRRPGIKEAMMYTAFQQLSLVAEYKAAMKAAGKTTF
jgi:hypothetical protein